MVKLETTGAYQLKPLTGQPRHFHQQKKKKKKKKMKVFLYVRFCYGYINK